MKQVLIKQGKAVVEEIPVPQVEDGTLLVQVRNSCISIGTEMSGIRASAMPLWKRALKQPQNVKKTLESIATQGINRTLSLVEGKLKVGTPIGYSASGVVLAIGKGIEDIRSGDRVACAGAQYAHHAEVIRVPRNLTVPLAADLSYARASTVTLGAIALQGIRRATPTLGESFVVIGMGILGQLTAQMLKANGCRVIGTDLDRNRIALARQLGLDAEVHPDDGNDIEQVMRLTHGIGADGVIITAATPSDDVVSAAFQMCRKKGRVVLVGDVGLNLNRADFYQKELDFFISTSYGPGRYDERYEEQGLDYPVGYVRWTENRNMEEYLSLVAAEKVKIDPLITEIFPVERAEEAYEKLKSGEDKPLMVLLSYSGPSPESGYSRRVSNPKGTSVKGDKIKVAVVGAGGFAKGMHLPNLQALSKSYQLQGVMSRTGHNAKATAEQFGFNYATTDFDEILSDKEVDLVLIATRHDLHASMALKALGAGKHVLLEKPLALTPEELNQIRAFYEAESSGVRPILLTGFNRRFSPYASRISEMTRNRTSPMIMNYRMNAGYIPPDHWVHGAEGGGRNIGEACHIYDLFTYLTGSRVISVEAKSIHSATGYYAKRDNFVATISFEDGSIGNLTYTALGSKDYPKEHLDIYLDGKVILLEDYKRLKVWGSKMKPLETNLSEKGQKEELEILAHALRSGGEWPIPFWQQIQATEISFEVERQISK